MFYSWSRRCSRDKMTSLYLFWVILLILTTGIYSYSMEIDEFSQSKAITICKEGLIANVDNYTVTARITAKLNTLQSRTLLSFQMYQQNVPFDYSLCHLYFSKTCDNVRQYSGCYCQQDYNGTFEIMVNKTAKLEKSEGRVFLKWPSAASGKQRETGTVKLPVIYQQKVTSLYVAKVQVLVDNNCTAYFDTYDVVRWCVKNLLRHTLTVSFDYGSFNSTDDCIQHRIRIHQATTKYFNISYEEHEGCQRSKVYTCIWHAIPQPLGREYSLGDYAFDSGLIMFQITTLSSQILPLLGFDQSGITKGSIAAKYERFVRKWNFGLRLMSMLQRAGHHGGLGVLSQALLVMSAGCLGIAFGLIIKIIKFFWN